MGMWLRTTMNFQYKNGGTTSNTIKYLYNDGGIKRFYRGLPYALTLGPLSRFGDTAANIGVMNYLNENKTLPISVKTGIASTLSCFWRIAIIPLDAFKSAKQVYGENGVKIIL